jgi:hypothetical protein
MWEYRNCAKWPYVKKNWDYAFFIRFRNFIVFEIKIELWTWTSKACSYECSSEPSSPVKTGNFLTSSAAFRFSNIVFSGVNLVLLWNAHFRMLSFWFWRRHCPCSPNKEEQLDVVLPSNLAYEWHHTLVFMRHSVSISFRTRTIRYFVFSLRSSWNIISLREGSPPSKPCRILILKRSNCLKLYSLEYSRPIQKHKDKAP